MINLRHVGLIVKDLEKSLKIYRDILNFEPKVDQLEQGKFFEIFTGIDNVKARTVKCFANDESCIELIEFYSLTPKKRLKVLNSYGFNHIALNVDDIYDLEKKLIKERVRFISAPTINPEKKAIVAFCKDFEGNLLELVQTKNIK